MYWSSRLLHGMWTCSPVHALYTECSCATTCPHPCAQIEKHDSHESTWFIHDGNVYDATKFLKDHPGKMTLLLSGVAIGACWACASAQSGTPL